MATTPTYRFIKDIVYGLESYAIATASGINTGDMCQWDTGSRIATNALLASGSIFLGVSENTNPLVSLGTASAPLTGGRLTIKSQGIYSFKTTSGDTYSHLDPVFQGADQQTVTKVAATRLVGRAWLPDGTQVTGATGTNVTVAIYGNMTNQSMLPSSASTVL